MPLDEGNKAKFQRAAQSALNRGGEVAELHELIAEVADSMSIGVAEIEETQAPQASDWAETDDSGIS